MARRAELARVALAAQHREQVFEGVAQPFAVVVGEGVNLAQEGAQGLRVAVGQIDVAEDVAEELGQVLVLDHLGEGFGIGIEHVLSGDAGGHKFRPAISVIFLGEETAFAA